jgi:protocatechuate 3,4-dioxygenase beta subunit
MEPIHPIPGENQNNKKLNRRKALRLLGLTAVSSVAGIRGASALNITTLKDHIIPGKPTFSVPSCIVRPQQIEGPYFVDEKLLRNDIRKDPFDNSMKEGVELKLIFNVSQITGNNCIPLPDAIVDLWQCDAEGIYAGVQDRDFDTRGKSFLRGYQITDSNGSAQFITIFPGWYRGRATHVHFKIRTGEKENSRYEFTSQIYFEDSLISQIYKLPPYAAKGTGHMENHKDGIFQNGGEELKLPLNKINKGYQGIFDIGLEIS